MTDLSKYKRYYFDGDRNQSQRNFQGYLFEDLNFGEISESVSFYRSDFRGSKFLNFKLINNNFDRADFIDSYIEFGRIEKCQFGTDFLNTYFSKVSFYKNDFESCSFSNCTFDHCEFYGDLFQEVGMRNCTFSDCLFEGVDFSMNTVDEVFFEKTSFNVIDFSNQTAINIHFVNCKFNEFKIDPDYIGSYFIRGDFLGEITFVYRGHEISLLEEQHEIFEGLITLYIENNRYYEALNMLFQKTMLDNSIGEELVNILKNLFREQIVIVKSYHIEKCLDVIQFYLFERGLQLSVFFFILPVVEKLLENSNELGSRVKHLNKASLIRHYLEEELLFRIVHTDEFEGKSFLIELEIGTNDREYAISVVKSFFNDLEKEIRISDDIKLYEIVNVKSGSIIMDVICYASLLVPLSYVYKRVRRNFNEVAVDYAYRKAAVKLLNNVESVEDMKEAHKIAKSYFKNDVNNLESFKGFREVLKSIKVFVNASD